MQTIPLRAGRICLPKAGRYFYDTDTDHCGFGVADAASAFAPALRVIKGSSDFAKEVVTLHVFCHVQMTECEVTVMMVGGGGGGSGCNSIVLSAKSSRLLLHALGKLPCLTSFIRIPSRCWTDPIGFGHKRVFPNLVFVPHGPLAQDGHLRSGFLL